MRYALVAALLLLPLPVRVSADEPGRTAAPATLTETTDVEGTVPRDILGRWLVVAQIKLPSGAITPTARMLELRRGREHPEVFLRRAELPDALSKKLRDAATASQAWTPADGDLHEVAEQWDALPPVVADYSSIESKLIGADAYPREFQVDETTKGSSFAITVREAFSGTQPLQRTHSVFAVRQQRDSHLDGTFVMSSIAVAPFPIPITLRGDFQAYRVAAPAAPSWWQRFLDVFSGRRG
jgi:hypothetical protein